MNRIPANFTLAEALPFMDISDDYREFLNLVDDEYHDLLKEHIEIRTAHENALDREEQLEEDLNVAQLEIERLEKQVQKLKIENRQLTNKLDKVKLL